MIRCSLCNDLVANRAQLDHYVDGHRLNVYNIWVTNFITKNSGEVVCTYKRMPLELATEMGLTR